MTQLSIRHISTNKYGHRLSAYETPKMTGYIVSVTADGITSQYDFLDSMELALQYREALGEAWEAWSSIIDKSPYDVSEALWVRYIKLAHHAPYPRWELEPVSESAETSHMETMAENCRRQALNGVDYGDAYDGRELVDQEPAYEGWN